MSKFIKFLLSFIESVLITIIVILGIIKWTVYSPSYFKNILASNNYYEKVSNDISDATLDYNVSSGLASSILNDLYTIDDVKEDINYYVDNYYLGNKITINSDKITTKLKENIDNYLLEYDVSIKSMEDINSYILEVGEIYTNKITLYGLLDGYAKTFKTLGTYINILIGVTFISLIINTLVLKKLKATYGASTIMASGLMLLFIRFVIFSEIEVTNLVIISPMFSQVVIEIYTNICNLTVRCAILLIVIGLLILLMKNNKEEKGV